MSRSIKKGLWVDPKLLKKILKLKSGDKTVIKTWSATNLASFLRQGNSSGMAAKCRKSWKPRRRRPKKRFPPRRLKLDTSIYRNLDIMQFKFYLRNLRIAPRKVRSVAALIK